MIARNTVYFTVLAATVILTTFIGASWWFFYQDLKVKTSVPTTAITPIPEPAPVVEPPKVLIQKPILENYSFPPPRSGGGGKRISKEEAAAKASELNEASENLDKLTANLAETQEASTAATQELTRLEAELATQKKTIATQLKASKEQEAKITELSKSISIQAKIKGGLDRKSAKLEAAITTLDDQVQSSRAEYEHLVSVSSEMDKINDEWNQFISEQTQQMQQKEEKAKALIAELQKIDTRLYELADQQGNMSQAYNERYHELNYLQYQFSLLNEQIGTAKARIEMNEGTLRSSKVEEAALNQALYTATEIRNRLHLEADRVLRELKASGLRIDETDAEFLSSTSVRNIDEQVSSSSESEAETGASAPEVASEASDTIPVAGPVESGIASIQQTHQQIQQLRAIIQSQIASEIQKSQAATETLLKQRDVLHRRQSELSQGKQEMGLLMEKLIANSAKVAALTERVAGFDRDLESLKAEQARLEGEISAAQRGNQQSLASLAELHKEKSALDAAFVAKSAEKDELTAKLDAVTLRTEEIRAEIKQFHQEIIRENGELTMKREELAATRAEKAVRNAESAAEKRASELEQDRNAAVLHELKKSNVELSGEIRSEELKLTELKAKATDVRTEGDQTVQAILSAQESLKGKKAQLEELNREQAALTATVQASHRALAELIAQSDSLQGDQLRLTEIIARLGGEIEVMTGTASQNESRKEALETKLGQLNAELALFTAQEAANQQSIRECTGILLESTAALAELEQAIAGKAEAIESQQGSLDSLNGLLGQQQVMNTNLKDRLSALNEEIPVILAASRKAEATNQRSKEQLARQHGISEANSQLLDHSQALISREIAARTEALKSAESKLTKLNEQLQERNRAAEALSTRISVATKNQEDLMATLSGFGTEKVRISAEIAGVESARKALLDNLADKQSEVGRNEGQIDAINSQITQLSGKRATKEEELTAISRQIDEKNAAKEAAIAEKVAAEVQLEALHAEIEQLKEQIGEATLIKNEHSRALQVDILTHSGEESIVGGDVDRLQASATAAIAASAQDQTSAADLPNLESAADISALVIDADSTAANAAPAAASSDSTPAATSSSSNIQQVSEPALPTVTDVFVAPGGTPVTNASPTTVSAIVNAGDALGEQPEQAHLNDQQVEDAIVDAPVAAEADVATEIDASGVSTSSSSNSSDEKNVDSSSVAAASSDDGSVILEH